MKRNKVKYAVLVDDDPDYTCLVEEALLTSKFPCTLKVFSTGVEFMVWLRLETSPRPNVIFMDINMPINNGLEMLEIIKSEARFKTIPVVMLTVSGCQEDIRESYLLGANAYMVKPLVFDELTEQMQIFSHYWFDVAQTLAS